MRFKTGILALLFLAVSSVNCAEELRNIPLKSIVSANTTELRDASITALNGDSGYTAKIILGTKEEWPGVSLLPADGKAWDFTPFKKLNMKVRNNSAFATLVCLRIDNDGADGVKNCITLRHYLNPGQEGVFELPISRGGIEISGGEKLEGMHGLPGRRLDFSKVIGFIVFGDHPSQTVNLDVGDIVLSGKGVQPKVMSMKEFLPFVDEYGQYIHANWPGKVSSDAELKADVAREEADLSANSASKEWNIYGGWANGPKYKATGMFRVDKIDGKWWLIDPEGCLFWSNGCASVWTRDYTPITDREQYFKWLPKDGVMAQFTEKGFWKNPPGFYKEYNSYECYNFRTANLFRKYGEDWKNSHYGNTEKRFRSWGVNTLGAWADKELMERGRIPYAMYLSAGSEPIEGSSGHWRKFPDPFSVKFTESLQRTFVGLKKDPMCIGYFVNNELAWGGETSLAVATLKSPATQPAKKAFCEYLQKKYATVEAVNSVWKSSYKSWDDFMSSVAVPDENGARADLVAFTEEIANRYFSLCREGLNNGMPGALFLGCRFAGLKAGQNIIRAAAKYSDIVSFNIYQKDVSSYRLPFEIDRPLIIGEFHFGALDRGLIHEGLVPVADQNERAAAYKSYIEGALVNPQIVGAHWFQYVDEPVSGRCDGENYQIGLVDVCDRPYPETINALREVTAKMYEIRSKGGGK